MHLYVTPFVPDVWAILLPEVAGRKRKELQGVGVPSAQSDDHPQPAKNTYDVKLV
jgi:hypothetical protein